jgi:hypothetical protein
MREYPTEMLDPNVRTDYAHLQRIGTLGGAPAAERRELLERILTEGHIRSDLVRQFGVKSLSSHTPYISLLYYLGMLTLREAPRDAEGYDLEIPNRVIRELQWEHLALMLKEQAQMAINIDDLKAALGAMVGTKKVLFRPWPPAPGAKPPRAGPKAAKPKAPSPRSRRKA